jgi:hypothetical protein
MGIRRSDYILIGADIGCDVIRQMSDTMQDGFWGAEENGNTVKGEITYLYDGYSNKYFIVGEVIQGDKDGYHGLTLFRAGNLSMYYDSFERVKKHIKDNFGIDNPHIDLIILTHWD